MYIYVFAFCVKYQIKTVILRNLGIFNGLLQTKNVKKYVQPEQLQDGKNNKFTEKKDENAIKQY